MYQRNDPHRAVAGTDKATIIKLRHQVAYLKAALADALSTPTAIRLTHTRPPQPPKPDTGRTPTTVRGSRWNRIDWTTPEARRSIEAEHTRIHHANTDKPGTGAERLATLGRETEAARLEHAAARHLKDAA